VPPHATFVDGSDSWNVPDSFVDVSKSCRYTILRNVLRITTCSICTYNMYIYIYIHTHIYMRIITYGRIKTYGRIDTYIYIKIIGLGKM